MAINVNSSHYADAFIELYKVASLLDVWGKGRESKILTAVLEGDDEAMDKLVVANTELLNLHSEISSALKEQGAPIEVMMVMDEIFRPSFAKVGLKLVDRSLIKTGDSKRESTVERLNRQIKESPKEFTRPTETKKIKEMPSPIRQNLDYGPKFYDSESSKEYFDKLDMNNMPDEKDLETGYEGLEDSYTKLPNQNINSGRFQPTKDGHKSSGVLILPSYMNDGIFYRDDVSHMIMEAIARRTTTGLSFYSGAVPIGKEELNSIGDLAMRMKIKGKNMLADKLSAMVFTSILKKASDMRKEDLANLRKTAYNNNAFETSGLTAREVVYPIRPESNIMQYAHNDKMISIDPRSLSGVIMRADVKNHVLESLSVKRPIGKTAEDLKVYYVKMLEDGGIYRAARFKKVAKILYDVDCGDIDDRILDVAHGRSVNLSEAEGALFPTQNKQQDIDIGTATSIPNGEVSDKPVKMASYIDKDSILGRYLTAKKKDKKDKTEKPDGDLIKRFKNLLEFDDGTPIQEDEEAVDVESAIPEEAKFVDMDGREMEYTINIENNSNSAHNVSFSLIGDPDTGEVSVVGHGVVEKHFKSLDDALDWSDKVSEIFNNVLDSASNLEASGARMSDFVRIADMHNAVIKYATGITTFSNNVKRLLEVFDDVA